MFMCVTVGDRLHEADGGSLRALGYLAGLAFADSAVP